MKALIKQALPIKLDESDRPCIHIVIENGKIAEISEQLPAGRPYDFVVDAKARCLVLPGLIDLSFHLPPHGLHSRTNLLSELNAAAAAGVSAICCMLEDGSGLEDRTSAHYVHSCLGAEKISKVLAIGRLNLNKGGRQVLNELARLIDDGCVAFSNGRHAFSDTRTLKRTLEYASDFGLPLLLQPMDTVWFERTCVHHGRVATRLGLPGIPRCAETAVLAQYLEVAREVDVAIHICRVSCARSVEMIARAKQDHLRVTADVAISHLFFSENDVSDFNPNMHTIPPLRSPADREALIAGVADGTIDVICSDHQAHDAHAKLAPFPSSVPGASTAEVMWPMIMQLIHSGSVPAQRALAAVTSSPARLLKLAGGSLQPGVAADLCLFDENDCWTVAADTLRSHGKNCPFLGHRCRGRVQKSFIDGEMVACHD